MQRTLYGNVSSLAAAPPGVRSLRSAGNETRVPTNTEAPWGYRDQNELVLGLFGMSADPACVQVNAPDASRSLGAEVVAFHAIDVSGAWYV